MLRIWGATQQQIPLLLLEGSRKHRNEDILENLSLQLLRVVGGLGEHLNKLEEDVPLLLDGVRASNVRLKVGREEVEGIDLSVKVDAEELEKGQHVVRFVLAVREKALEQHGAL